MTHWRIIDMRNDTGVNNATKHRFRSLFDEIKVLVNVQCESQNLQLVNSKHSCVCQLDWQAPGYRGQDLGK